MEPIKISENEEPNDDDVGFFLTGTVTTTQPIHKDNSINKPNTNKHDTKQPKQHTRILSAPQLPNSHNIQLPPNISSLTPKPLKECSTEPLSHPISLA